MKDWDGKLLNFRVTASRKHLSLGKRGARSVKMSAIPTSRLNGRHKIVPRTEIIDELVVRPTTYSGPMRYRNQANARERDRTHSVNEAYTSLRQLIPTEPADRKLSKIETLRLATSYISHLRDILDNERHDRSCWKQAVHLIPGDEHVRRGFCTFCFAARKKSSGKESNLVSRK